MIIDAPALASISDNSTRILGRGTLERILRQDNGPIARILFYLLYFRPEQRFVRIMV